MADDQHVGIVPVAGRGERLVSALREADARHARPRVGDVAGRAPEIPADFSAPLPDISRAVLAQTEDDVAADLVERCAHHTIRFLAVVERGIRRDLAVRAPVVLQVVEAPLRVRLRVLFLVLVAAGVDALARERPGRRVETDLQSLAVDVVSEPFHVRKLLVRRDLAVRVARPLPRIVDVDELIALRRETGAHHGVGRRAHFFCIDRAAPDVPRVPAERRRLRERVIARDDRQRARRGAFRTGHGQRDDGLAGFRERTGDDAALRVERETGGKILRRERQRTVS